jgi:hypothetical protein
MRITYVPAFKFLPNTFVSFHICVVHLHVFTYIISIHYLLVTSMKDIWNSHYYSLASANTEHS